MSCRLQLLVLALCALVVVLVPSQASAFCQGTSIVYSDFSPTTVTTNVNTSSVGIFQMGNPDAVTYTGNTMLLVPNSKNTAASAWFSKPFVPSCTECFNVSFAVTFTTCTSGCGDGMTFVIQNVGPLMGLGASGDTMGLFTGNMPISTTATISSAEQFVAVAVRPPHGVVAVYNNAYQSVDSPNWKSTATFSTSSVTAYVWIDNGCQAGNQLNVYYSLSGSTKPSTPQITASVSGSSVFNTAPSGGSTSFYVGFTAGQGSDYSNIAVTNFNFNAYSNNACTGACPAVGTGLQCQGPTYGLTDFSSISINDTAVDGMTLNGNAVISGTTLQLTTNTNSQAGSAFFNEPFNAQCNECFSGYYQTTIDECSSGSCADGMLMVLSSSTPTYLGGSGSALGFLNGQWQAFLGVGMEVYDSPKLLVYNQANQATGSPAASFSASYSAFNYASTGSQTVSIWFDNACSGSSTLNIYASMTGTKPSTPTLIVNTTTSPLYGTSSAVFANGNMFYVGFSGGTGGNNQRTRINAMNFTSWSASPCSTSCPTVKPSGSCPGMSFSYPDFSTASQTKNPGTFSMTTAYLNTSSSHTNFLQLVTTGSQAASAWYTIPYQPVCYECIQVAYTFMFDTCVNGCADGLSFVIQNTSPTYIGSSGGDLGVLPYSGTSYTSTNQFVAASSWIYDNKFIVYNNANQNTATPASGWTASYTYTQAPTYLNVWLDDDCSGLEYINVFYATSTIKPATPMISIDSSGLVNPSPSGGSQNFYVGFTGGTGGSSANIRVTSANFTAWTNECRYPCQSFTHSATESLSQSATASYTRSATQSATFSATQSFTASPTGSHTQSFTASPTGSHTQSATYSATASFTPSPTASMTESQTGSYTASLTNSATDSATHSLTASATESFTASATHSFTESATQSATHSTTASATDSATESLTNSATGSFTMSATATFTESFTDSLTQSATASYTQSATESLTQSATESFSQSATESFTESATESVTVSFSESATATFTESATGSLAISASESATVTEMATESATASPAASYTELSTASGTSTPTPTASVVPSTPSTPSTPMPSEASSPSPSTGSTPSPSTGSTPSPSTGSTPSPSTGSTPSPSTGSTPSPSTGSTPSPSTGSTPSPSTGSTPSPSTGTTPSPSTGTTPSPSTGSTPSPSTGSTPSPSTGTTPSPSTGSTPSPSTGWTPSPSTGSTPSPTTGSTPAPSTGSTAAPSSPAATTSPAAPTVPASGHSVLYFNSNSHGNTPSVDVYQPTSSGSGKRSTSYVFVMRLSMVACGSPNFFATHVDAPAGVSNWDPSTLGLQFVFVNSTGATIAVDGPSCDPSAPNNVYSNVGTTAAADQQPPSLVASPNGCNGTVVSSFSGTYDNVVVQCAGFLVGEPTPSVPPAAAASSSTSIIVSVVVVFSVLLLAGVIGVYFFVRYRRAQLTGDNKRTPDAEELSDFQFVHSAKPKDEPIEDPVQALNRSDLELWNEAKKPVVTPAEPPLTWDPTPDVPVVVSLAPATSVKHIPKSMRAKESPVVVEPQVVQAERVVHVKEPSVAIRPVSAVEESGDEEQQPAGQPWVATDETDAAEVRSDYFEIN